MQRKLVNRNFLKFKRRLTKCIKKILKNSIAIWGEINKLYTILFVMILCGIVLLILGGITYNKQYEIAQNILFGTGTGMVSSSIVTFFIEVINKKEKIKRNLRVRKIVFFPLIKSTKILYVALLDRINEYQIKVNKKDYFLIPISDINIVHHFFEELKEMQIDSAENTVVKIYESILSIPVLYFRNFIFQYESLPFENLLFEEIISKEEYDKLKSLRLIIQAKSLIAELGNKPIIDKETRDKKITLIVCMIVVIERLYENLDFIRDAIIYENENIKPYFDELYYYEVYCNSEEYFSRINEDYQRYYEDNHHDYEEINEEKMLIDEIAFAIMIFDKKSMIELFKKIDHNNVEIKNILNSKDSKEFMRDKDMKELYYEKYGEQYKDRLF